ncbi:MAG TPA: phytanoyl-CoA dioxygenase family protein [Chthonomonadaceae bacterium]|nr:phytanoyl-CoA dioxygenase family protein [Chthonomonadaceae bacterium]
MKLLTEADRRFLDENGYLVAPGIVPVEDCEAVIDALFDFLEMKRDDPSDWYRHPLKPGGMVEIYQHQALWNNRQNPRMHALFSDIYGTDALYVTIDRVGFKPPYNPEHPEFDHRGFTHWDIDTNNIPARFGVQAVLCLTDTTAEMGGFQCVPGFHIGLEEWVSRQPADRNPRVPDLASLPPDKRVTPIPASAGSMIIWNNRLLHGNGRNIGQRPRFSQYISMYPADRMTPESREHRIRCWQNREPPGGTVFPGDPREIEQNRYKTADLTDLGRKLLGIDPW